MATGGKSKKSSSAKSPHLETEAKGKSTGSKKPQRASKTQVRLSVNDKERPSTSSGPRKSSLASSVKQDEISEEDPLSVTDKSRPSTSNSARKSSLASSLKQDDTRKSKEVNNAQEDASFADDEESRDGKPLDPEKSMEKAKVVKQFLEKKYKVEFPKGGGYTEVSEETDPHLTEREILVRNGVDMDLSLEEQMNLLKVYNKLEEGIEQAEEFFRSIGIEWCSEEQMFKVKPKKFMPAMTMIAFGQDYDDVIVCKDDEETGETQACVLSKGNTDCPKDVTAVNLNVYKDGFQAEDDEFNAYTSDSIRDFFLNNIGSYIIMKPNDSTPQTVLIRVIDEREKSFDDVQKEREEGFQKPSHKPNKRPKRKANSRKSDTRSEVPDEYEPKAKYYTQSNVKAPTTTTETVEIFEKHKIIKRLEDMPIEETGMASSSWYWKNQRNPVSSEYFAPPNTIASENESQAVQDQKTVGQSDVNRRSTDQAQEPTKASPNTHDKFTMVPDLTKDEATSITDSFLKSDTKANTDSTAVTPANRPPSAPMAQAAPINNQLTMVDQIQHFPQHSETKINKINVYHGPVTVINIGEASDDSVRISPQPDNKLKVSMRREQQVKRPVQAKDREISLSSSEWNEFVRTEELHTKEWNDREQSAIADHWNYASRAGADNGDERKRSNATQDSGYPQKNFPNMYETEYDYAYNKTASKWSEFIADSAKKKSTEGETEDLTNATYEHITLLGQQNAAGQEDQGVTKEEKKVSVLLDLGNFSGKKESFEGIELNKKTSDTQITVALRDNVNGKKYLVNIYPEEQLKKIWSVLRMNRIDVQNVTPELVLGNSELQKNITSSEPGSARAQASKADLDHKMEDITRNKKGEQTTPSQITQVSKDHSKDAAPKITEVSSQNVAGSDNSGASADIFSPKPPSIQSDAS